MLFFAAVMVSTWYGGLGPGLLATALAAFISDYFFLGPAYSLFGNKPGQNLDLCLFVLEGVLTGVLISKLQAAKHRAEISRRKAEKHQETLRQSEERFRLLVEDVKDYAIFMLDLEGRVVSWNIGGERILGYQEAEIVGKHFSCIFTPEDLQNGRPESALRTAVAEGRTEGDLWHVRKDGTWFWATGVMTPLRDEAGNLLGFSKILRDRTKIKLAQDALQKSEERLRLFVENVKDYAIFMLDSDGRVASWNIGAERILGYQEAEIVGKHFSCIYTPEDLQNGRPEYALRTAVAEGRTQDDRWHVRKDGTWFWANGVVTPLRDKAGNLQGFSKILRDYTKIKLAQDALHKSEERLRLLVENVKDYAIFMLDPDGRVASWNIGTERILGYQEAEIIGQPFSRFFPPEAMQQGVPEQELRTAVAEGQSEEERWHVRKDGTRFWATEVTTALRDETGNLRGFSKVMRDITERKQAEEERAELLVHAQAARAEAEAANRTKDEFLSIVSHELRTPLASILLWTELLQTGNLDEGTTAQALEIIQRNTKSQSQLVEDLLDISRIITGNLRFCVDLVELVPVIQAAVDSLSLAAEAKGIQIQTVVNAEVGQVLGDATRLQQVVSNLLSNAIKFTPNGGRVEVQVSCTDSQVYIIVSDTGQGISPEFLPYVFDRFRQANSTPTRSDGGLGLGLAIVRHLVELHGGTVSVQSPGEGGGATFTVTLPLAVIPKKKSDEERVLRSSEDTVFDNSLLDGLWVLIVDDEADMREALAVVLQQCGAEVLAVTSTAEALFVLTIDASGRKPDVLLCDIGMPGEDGYTLLSQVRALPPEQGGRIPAAALTAYAREEDRTRALLAGFQLHVPKPINPTELIAVVASLARHTGKEL